MVELAREPLWPEQLPTETAFEFEALKAWLRERPRPEVPEPLLELAERRRWLERACAFDWSQRLLGLEPAEQVRLTLEAARQLLCVSAQKMLDRELQSPELRLKPEDFNALLKFFSDPANAPRERAEFEVSALNPEEQKQLRGLLAKAKKEKKP